MIPSSYRRVFFPLILIFSLSITAYSQFFWRINGEGGYYSAQGSQILDQGELVTRLNTDLKYMYEFKNSITSFDIKIRPELYGLDNHLQIIKLRGKGHYLYKARRYHWGIDLSAYHYLYSGQNLDLSFNNLIIETNLFWLRSPARLIQANLGYAFQSTHRFGDFKLNLLFMQMVLYRTISAYFRYGYGIYLEKFYITLELYNYLKYREICNSGWRTGPLLSLNYLRNFIVNMDYRFLLHYSDYTTYPSYEHYLRLMIGKIFYTRWSAFLVVDYYIPVFKRKTDIIEEVNVLYTPINLQNRIFLKLAYDVKENIEVYIRYGYFKESLYYYNDQFAGWSGLVGLEIRN